MHDRGMSPDPGLYEERYRLSREVASTLVGPLVFAGLGFVWRTSVYFTLFLVVAAVLGARAAGAFAAVRRAVAFRTNYAGITLGAVPGQLGTRNPAVFVPWADVEQIVLYPAHPGGRGRYGQAECIGIRRRDGAPPLAKGNEQAPHCPVPGVAAGATRRIAGWRLDRDRLAAVTAAVAPGISVVETNTTATRAMATPASARADGRSCKSSPTPSGMAAATTAVIGETRLIRPTARPR